MPQSHAATTHDALYAQRNEILQQLAELPPFRRGTVTEHARTCGKASCRCRQSSDQRHVAYQWTASFNGKTAYKTLHLGPQVEKYLEETSTYKRYRKSNAQYLHINEQIADLQVPASIPNQDDLEALKKNCGRDYRGNESRIRSNDHVGGQQHAGSGTYRSRRAENRHPRQRPRDRMSRTRLRNPDSATRDTPRA